MCTDTFSSAEPRTRIRSSKKRKKDVPNFLHFSGKNLNSEFIFPQFDGDVFKL